MKSVILTLALVLSNSTLAQAQVSKQKAHCTFQTSKGMAFFEIYQVTKNVFTADLHVKEENIFRDQPAPQFTSTQNKEVIYVLQPKDGAAALGYISMDLETSRPGVMGNTAVDATITLNPKLGLKVNSLPINCELKN